MSNKYFEYEKLLALPIENGVYSDRMSWLMAKMSKLACLPFEKDDGELQAALAEAGFKLIKAFNSQGTQAFLAKRDSDKLAVLVFRGTQTQGVTLETFFDVFTDLYAEMRKDENGVMTHKGFLQAFRRVELEVLQHVKELSGYKFYITGHSLGGALALIAASVLALKNKDLVAACYTFGSPKVGNAEFDDKIKSPIYRIVNAYDVVPFLPFTPIMSPVFGLISKRIKSDKVKVLIENFKEYQHHGELRYLTYVASSSDVKVLKDYNELIRALNLIRLSFTVAKDIGVQHHSLDVYCDKLAQWALKK